MSFGFTGQATEAALPWPTEKFNGYFTDIRRAVRKSLPRRPDKELASMLGLDLVPVSQGLGERKTGQDGGASLPVLVTTEATVPSATQAPDIKQESNLPTDCDDCLPRPCRCSVRTRGCTKRERTVVGISLYLAVVILLLLIVVIVLATNVTNISTENNVSVQTGDTMTRDTNTGVESSPAPTRLTSLVEKTNPGATTRPVTQPSEGTPTLKRTDVTTRDAVASTEVTDATASIPTSQQPSVTDSQSPGVTSSSAQTVDVSAITSSQTSSPVPGFSTSTTAATETATTAANQLPLLTLNPVTCTLRDCLSANQTLSRVDSSVSPCQDFYSFSCGRWKSGTQSRVDSGEERNVPSSLKEEVRQTLLLKIKDLLEGEITGSESLSEIATKSMYQSCLASNHRQDTVQGWSEVHAYLDPLGVQPNITTLNSLESMVHDAIFSLDSSPLFDVTAAAVVQDTHKQFRLQLSPPSLFLDRQYYLQGYEESAVAQKYVAKQTDLLYAYLTSFDMSDFKRRRRRRSQRSRRQSGAIDLQSYYGRTYLRVLAAFEAESEIAKILPTETTSQQETHASTTTMTISELQATYPNINWNVALGRAANVSSVDIVYPDFFTGLNDIAGNLPLEDIKLYVFLNILIRGVWKYGFYPLRVFLDNIGSHTEKQFTEKDCIENTLGFLSEDIHALYVSRFTQDVLNTRITLNTLTNDIGLTLQTVITSTEWIETDLKRVAQVFLQNLAVDFSQVRPRIRNAPVFDRQDASYLELALELHTQKMDALLRLLDTNVTSVVMDWTSAEVYVDTTLNAIGLPTGLLGYLSDNDPLFKMYGTVGAMIAEQIVKTFTGELTQGRPPNWWGEQNSANFQVISACFLDQLASTQAASLILADAIHGQGGMYVTEKVYTSRSSTEDREIPGTAITEGMLFYINYAQLYCHLSTPEPSLPLETWKERVNIVLKNSVEFRQTFACPTPSAMSPSKRCSLFQ